MREERLAERSIFYCKAKQTHRNKQYRPGKRATGNNRQEDC